MPAAPSVVSAALAWVVGAPASLSPTPSAAPEGPPAPIYGGAAASACAWPTAVALYDGGGGPFCSGVLIHPQVVAYAAHCGTSFGSVRFGEDATAPKKVVATKECVKNPAADGTPAIDWAYCVLQSPVVDVPATPPLYGCEAEALVEGAPVWLVGFGEIEDKSKGRKYAVMAPVDIVPFMESMVLVGGGGIGTCGGDSGAPGYLQLADGTWRVVGVTFGTTLTCGGGTVLLPTTGFVPWLEERSGIDVTPCHAVDGTWAPDGRCDRFAAAPGDGEGAWGEWCTPATLGGPGALCGEPYDAVADRSPPSVTITAPADGASYDAAPMDVLVTIDAADGEGWGVAAVDLKIDGEALGLGLSVPPYGALLTFPAGEWTLVASARDYGGNTAESAAVTIVVGTPPASTTSGGEGSGGESSDGTSSGGGTSGSSGGGGGASGATGSDVGSGGDGGAESEGGCACGQGGGGPAGALGLVMVGWWRRRSLA